MLLRYANLCVKSPPHVCIQLLVYSVLLLYFLCSSMGTIVSISALGTGWRHCVGHAMQVWQMQTPQVMMPLHQAMRHCLHLCCQCLPARLSCRAYRLALHLPLSLLAGGCSIHRYTPSSAHAALRLSLPASLSVSARKCCPNQSCCVLCNVST